MEFDSHFLDFNSKSDAVAIVAWLVNTGGRGAGADDIAVQFTDWTVRRVNSALHYLDDKKVVITSKGLHPKWAVVAIALNDKSRRFAKENA